MENIKYIIESLLFVAEEPLKVDRIKNITTHAETSEIREALAELAAEYETRQGGFYLDEVAGGYQIRTRPEYTEWIKKLIQPKPLRISKAALETLVIIAYKQPIIRSDIEYLRGVDCGGVLRMLLERKLIRVLGRREMPGRPLIYATTRRFLEVFDLKDLKDLPTPKEIEELGASLTATETVVSSESEAQPDSAEDTTIEPGAAVDNSARPAETAEETPESSAIAEDQEQLAQASPAPAAETEFARDTLLEKENDQPIEKPFEKLDPKSQ